MTVDILVSSDFARKFGCDSACLWGYLIKKEMFYEANRIADTSNGIPLSIEEVKNDLGLSRRQQTTAIENLVNAGYLKVERKGLPCRRYFTILR